MRQVVRRIYCAVVALMVVVWAVPAGAQTGPDLPTQRRRAGTRASFFRARHFICRPSISSGDDPRYVWDADFGGELDIVDYGAGRVTFEANYQVVLGEEIRSFDPNQGNYILAGLASFARRRH